MFESCLQKQENVRSFFSKCVDKEQIYQKIIQLGKDQPPLQDRYKTPENEVPGCQSLMYLHAEEDHGKIIFQMESDSLISSGLAAMLISVYSGETPETILKCPPDFLEQIGIASSLTPNRANGLYSIHLKMKKIALKSYLQNQSFTESQ